MSANLMNAMRVLSQRSMTGGSQLSLRGGHGHVDSWIRNGQAPRSSVPFRAGPDNKLGTAARVFGFELALPVVLIFGAVALAQSKA